MAKSKTKGGKRSARSKPSKTGARHKERTSKKQTYGDSRASARPARGGRAARTPTLQAETGAKAEPDGVVRCTLAVHPQGFGFAERQDGDGTVFVPAPHRAGAMDGDEVLVAWWPGERGPEGAVRSVVARARTRLTGILRRRRGHYELEPDDPRVLDPISVTGKVPSDALDAVVLADIIEYPLPQRGRIVASVARVLGLPGSLATEELKILIEHGVDPEFSPQILEAATEVPAEVREEDFYGRADLRALPFMTIDPPDARDFDDAVCFVDQDDDMARVHVAVADVSHYVREGDVFDVEAALRCFSCYLPDRSVPMLPRELSSGICSLVPKEDRLAMVVSFDVDGRGHVTEVEVQAAVIHSRARLTYEDAAKMLSTGKGEREIVERVVGLRAIADRLRRARLSRGAIELSLPEVKVRLDEDDPERVRAIEHARANPEIARAYNLIEELMLAANEAVAQVAVRHRLPVLFRVHAEPDEERVERFCAIAGLLGVETDPEALRTPKGMQHFLHKLDKHPRRGPIHSLLLRALAQAEYGVANIGHFALASSGYLHFTSPIRRYADLLDHRVLKAWLSRVGGYAGSDPVPHMPERAAAVASAIKASERERAIMQAERDAKALLCAAFMRDRIGDRFEGTITGLSNGGVFVTLDDPPVDGMIRRTALERETRDNFAADELMAKMVGSRSGATLAIGDRVMVELVDASISRRQIDLAWIRNLSL